MTAQTAETVADALTEQIDAERATTSGIQATVDTLVATGIVPKRVVIEVRDGTAYVTYTSPDVEVQIIDHSDGYYPLPIVPLEKENAS